MATRVVPALEGVEGAPSAAEKKYSVDKFMALQHYLSSVSLGRVTWVLLSTPVYGLVCALLPSFVPLQDPLDPRGVPANPGFLINIYLLCLTIFVGIFTHWRASIQLSDTVYSSYHVLVAGTTAATAEFAFTVMLAIAWRFPIPMSWIVVSAFTGLSITLGHLAAFGSRCWKDKLLLEAILGYVPALNLQTLQLLLYPAFSVIFSRVSTIYQVLLTLLFPLLKHFLKRWLKKLTYDLDDFSTEVAVSGIEICAALYQSMIMQSAPSKLAMAIVMGVDVVQGLVMVKYFMDRRSGNIPQHLIVMEAVKELKQQELQLSAKGPGPLDSACITKTSLAIGPGQGLTSTASSFSTTPRFQSLRSQPPKVQEALELVNTAESILLIEYLEVAIPIMNALFVSISCQFSGAQYNIRLRRLYFHPEALRHAVGSVLLYSLLQGASFMAMYLVMKYRYGLSAVYHLAFLLERHRASIVGKSLSWLPIILHFTGIHYGVDFSFQFDFAAMLQDPTIS